MKIEEYNQIRAEVRKYRGLTKDCARRLFAMFSKFPENTLRSILNQETQWKMKITHKQIYCNEEFNFYNSYLEAFQRGDPPGIVRNMAIQLNTCPAMLARKVLEEYYKADENVSKSDIQKMMRDTTLIPHASLAYEVYLCVLYDDQYGAVANSISDSVGEEYEIKLEGYLKERNIPYYNEDDLRTRGYDKTPDIRLEVPIAVNGFVINWIESKAQFGSPDNHVKYKKEQFLSYWNRFGSGLVVYWFGFVDNIVKSDENRFIVMDHFPENITYMDPYSISPTPA